MGILIDGSMMQVPECVVSLCMGDALGMTTDSQAGKRANRDANWMQDRVCVTLFYNKILRIIIVFPSVSQQFAVFPVMLDHVMQISPCGITTVTPPSANNLFMVVAMVMLIVSEARQSVRMSVFSRSPNKLVSVLVDEACILRHQD